MSELKTGWWTVTYRLEGEEVNPRDLSDVTLEHIGRKIAEGYGQGEIIEEVEDEA